MEGVKYKLLHSFRLITSKGRKKKKKQNKKINEKNTPVIHHN